jgi:hypothetical protein
MLPFLKPQRTVSVIIAKRQPDASLETKGEEGEEDAGLMAACDDILRAIEVKDSKALATALRAANDCMEGDEGETE